MRFLNLTWIKSALFMCGMLGIVTLATGQSDLGSPYSVFGPGLPVARQSISQAGMGGAGVALFDPYRLNLINPAAAVNHQETIFEMGGVGQISTFKTNESSFDNQRFVLNNLSLAFPIKKGVWNMNFGLVPLTKVSYDFVSRQEADDIGSYKAEYRGDGGISQSYIGTAYKLYNKQDTAGNITAFSLGTQLNYNFGPINNLRRLTFEQDISAMGLTIRESYLVRAFSWEFGAQFQKNLIKRSLANARYLKFSAGAVYRLGNDFDAERSNYIYNWRPRPGGGEAPRDTLFSSTRVQGVLRMPSSFIGGIGLDYVTNSRKRIRFALDYTMQQWSAYEELFTDEPASANFNDAHGIAVGLEYTPNFGSPSLLKRIEYRVGYRTLQTAISVAETDISDSGISFGMSLPVNNRQSLSQSRFSLAVEYGTFGTTNNGLVQEDYVRIMAGFSLTPHFRNRWFVKPKYD